MRKVHVYPRGFMSGAGNDVVDVNDRSLDIVTINVEGDAEIMALFNEYQNKPHYRMKTEFKLAVCRRMITLMGPLDMWVNRQFNNNKNLHGINMEFLEDTMRFIASGQRSMSNLLSWHDMLNEYPDPMNGVTLDRWNVSAKRFGSQYNLTYVGKWLSHRTGFDDLMMTAYIMFGDAKASHSRPHKNVV